MDALALLEPEPGFWPAAGVDEPGLGQARRDAAERTVELRLESLRAQAQAAFYAVDLDLSTFVEAERDALVARLQEGGLVDAPGALREAFARKATELDYAVDQVPEEWRIHVSGRAMGSAARLARACEDLADEETRVAGERALRLFGADDLRASELCALRRYARAIALWEQRLEASLALLQEEAPAQDVAVGLNGRVAALQFVERRMERRAGLAAPAHLERDALEDLLPEPCFVQAAANRVVGRSKLVGNLKCGLTAVGCGRPVVRRQASVQNLRVAQGYKGSPGLLPIGGVSRRKIGRVVSHGLLWRVHSSWMPGSARAGCQRSIGGPSGWL